MYMSRYKEEKGLYIDGKYENSVLENTAICMRCLNIFSSAFKHSSVKSAVHEILQRYFLSDDERLLIITSNKCYCTAGNYN
jgi:hypothetical protein